MMEFCVFLLSFLGVFLGWVSLSMSYWVRSFELEKVESNRRWLVVLFLVLTREWVLCFVLDTFLEYFNMKRRILFTEMGWDCYLSICRKYNFFSLNQN